MCGVFGYLSRGGRPNLDRLRRIALVTETRGRHAFGMAWIDANGGIGTWKRPGPAGGSLDALELVRDAVLILGHCRYATNGDPTANENNHPHRAGRGWIVHNGTVRNHRLLARRYDLEPRGECDSEVLGLLLAKLGGKLETRAKLAMDLAVGDMAILGLWNDPVRLLVAKAGKPLHCGKLAADLYLASLPMGLPGKVYSVRDGWAGVLAV